PVPVCPLPSDTSPVRPQRRISTPAQPILVYRKKMKTIAFVTALLSAVPASIAQDPKPGPCVEVGQHFIKPKGCKVTIPYAWGCTGEYDPKNDPCVLQDYVNPVYYYCVSYRCPFAFEWERDSGC
ncbi:hypothetical protein Tdes44962_MAKER02835, partial [Teratosphaeria destructans]